MDEYDLIKESKKELESFYARYFVSKDELDDFLSDAFDYTNGSLTRRQALFQVQWFVSLANDIDQIRPRRDPLRVMFLNMGLDALRGLAGFKNKKVFYTNFCNCFSNEGRDYILNNFKLSNFEDEYKGLHFETSHDIDLYDFFCIIKVARDRVVHDFNYWGMQFFAYDDESTWVSTMKTKEKLIKSYKYHRTENKETAYIFETTLNYEKFIYYFTEACVRFINKYF